MSLLALTVSTGITTVVVTQLIVNVKPWYDPQYLIPLVGMILGNSLTGISLGMDQFLGALKTETADVEAKLFMGASIWEATMPLIRRGIFHAHIPILNAMTVVGIVSLPGMMTGQLLSGISPMLAIRYQIMVMFMITAACSLGSVTFVLLSALRLFTPWHQLDQARIAKKD